MGAIYEFLLFGRKPKMAVIRKIQRSVTLDATWRPPEGGTPNCASAIPARCKRGSEFWLQPVRAGIMVKTRTAAGEKSAIRTQFPNRSFTDHGRGNRVHARQLLPNPTRAFEAGDARQMARLKDVPHLAIRPGAAWVGRPEQGDDLFA